MFGVLKFLQKFILLAARRSVSKPGEDKSKVILQHMQGIVAKRPLDISMETVTLCNARCTFCAYNKCPATSRS